MDTAINLQTANPFVGLRPFRSEEALLFFGRFEQTTELMQKLHGTRFLGIVGSSGCGKSSLIRAGLIPKLKARCLTSDTTSWLVAVMKPGDAPLRNLAAALLETVAAEPDAAPTNSRAPQLTPTAVGKLVDELRLAGAGAAVNYLTPPLGAANASLLLLVDQFEEVFHFGVRTADPDKRDEAADFVAIMLELARQDVLPIYVVMTMRSDYLGECDHFHGLPEALNASQYLVPRLTRRQRRQAIEGPIKLFSEEITPRLIDQVLNDVGDQPDQLPVMQHALMRTWQCWRKTDDAALDLPHYQRAGTVKHALSLDADNALRGLSLSEYKIARRLFQALTHVDERNRLVRRQRHLKELEAVTGASRAQLLKIIDSFQSEGRALLILEDDKLTDDPLVDISHETLIRQWKRLGRWLQDESNSRDIYCRLAADAARYEKDRAKGRLWRDPELAQALKWYAGRQPTAVWARRYHPEVEEVAKGKEPDALREAARRFAATTTFLKESFAEREALLAEEQAEQREKEAQLREKEAQRERERVVARRLGWLSGVLVAAFLLSAALGVFAVTRNQALRKQKLELEGARASEQKEKEKAFRQEKEAKDKTQQLLVAEESLQESVTALKAEKQKAIAAQHRAETLQRETAITNQALLATQQRLYESQTKLEGALAQAEAAAAAEKQQREAAVLAAQKLQTQYDIINEQRSQCLAAYSGFVRGSQGENSDLSALLAAHALRKLRQEDAPAPRIAGQSGAPTDADEDYALTQDANRAVRQFLGGVPERSLARRVGSEDRKIDGGAGPMFFTPDKRWLATLGGDRTVRVLDAESGELQGQTRQLEGIPSLIVLSQDGRHLATTEKTAEHSLVRVWRVGKDEAGKRAMGQLVSEVTAKPVQSLALSPDGQRLVTGGTEGVQLWETGTGEEIPVKPEDKPKGTVGAVAFNPQDGSLVVSGADEDTPDDRGRAKSAVYLLDAATGRTAGLKIAVGCECAVRSLTFDRTGKYLVIGTNAFETRAGEEGERVQVWNLALRRMVARAAGGAELIAFSPNRNYLAMSDGRRVIRLARLDWRKGRSQTGASPVEGTEYALPEYTSMLHDGNVRALAFSADESQLAAVSDQSMERVWETGSRAAATGMALPDNDHLSDIAFNRQGSLLATADGRNVRKLGAPDELPLAIPPTEQIRVFAFSQDGQRLATLSDKGQVRVADVGEPWGAVRTRIEDVPVPPEQQNKLGTVALSPRGQYLVMRNRERVVTPTNAPSAAGFPALQNTSRAISVTRLGAEGAGAAPVSILKIEQQVDAFAFNRDETRLATITVKAKNRPGANRTEAGRVFDTWSMKIWDLANPQRALQEIDWRMVAGRHVTTAAFSPDGNYLLTAAQSATDSVLRVWDLRTGQEQESFRNTLKDLGRVRSIIFDRAGRYMVLARDNDSAELWEMSWGKDKSAKRVAELPERAHKLAFDTQEQRLAMAAQGRAALGVWRAADLVRETCARVGRNLTYDEWRQYLRDLPYTRTCANLPVHQSVIDAAIRLAGEGNIPLAAELFRQIKDAQPDLNLEPVKEAEWHEQAQEHEEKLRKAGNTLSEVRGSNPDAMRTILPVAIADYKKAREFYSNKAAYRSVFNQPDRRKPELIFPQGLGGQLNSLCWWGSLNGHAADVKSACEQAVAADPYDANRRDSRGVARLLTADSPKDIDDAIEDFQAYINWSGNKGQKKRRECLIQDLRTGNPFQDEKRERLLKELREDSVDDSGACAYQQRPE